MSDFEVMLQRTTSSLPLGLDLLCLFGAMYREACLSFRPYEAKVLGHFFEIALNQVCSEDWISKVRNRLSRYARHRVLYGMRDYCSPPEFAEVSIDEVWNEPSLVVRRCV